MSSSASQPIADDQRSRTLRWSRNVELVARRPDAP
jgi:hypothetical protein